MLLAEALAERKDVLKRIGEYPAKVVEFAVWDEDEKKPDAAVLVDLNKAYAADLDRLEELNVKIHKANAVLTVQTEQGEMTIMEAIALRDRLNLGRISADRTKQAVESALGRHSLYRRSRSKEDVRIKTLVAPRDIAREEDALAGEIRRLDLAIQMVNWSQELPE